MSLLPSKPDTSAAEDAEPRVVGVESDDADELIGALSSETARRLLGELHDDPAPPAELADRVDTTLQNAQYHLEKLECAGAVEVIDTAYSEKGREMDVYAPADRPLVIFAGDQDSTTSIRTALSRLLGGVGLLALVSVGLQSVFGGGLDELLPGFGAGGASGPAANGTVAAAQTGTPAGGGTPAPEATDAALTAAGPRALDTAAGAPIGLVFFLGGVTVLLAGFAVWYLRQ